MLFVSITIYFRYDFAIFGACADIIAVEYFPHTENHSVALLKSFGVFGAAFCARPLGVIPITK